MNKIQKRRMFTIPIFIIAFLFSSVSVLATYRVDREATIQFTGDEEYVIVGENNQESKPDDKHGWTSLPNTGDHFNIYVSLTGVAGLILAGAIIKVQKKY
jgi:LPXTG-motif cell wall-anchored protein